MVFDMGKLVTRYFDLKFTDGMMVQVEPPKLKVLKKIMDISKIDDDSEDDTAVDLLAEGLSMALSKNKQGKEISVEYITDNLDLVEIMTLLAAYFAWVGEIQKQKN